MADAPLGAEHPRDISTGDMAESGLADHQPAEPTVARMWVGAQLRRLRERRGVTLEEAAYQIRGSASKLSRMELGRHGIRLRDVADLLTFYEVTDPAERGTLFALVKQADAPGWWQPFTDLIPDWHEPLLSQEQAASVIRTYEAQLLPTWLQTAAYARAALAARYYEATDEELERRTSLHMRRQDILRRRDRPSLWSVVDEAALRRSVGGPATMRAQIRHLIEVAELPHVKLQVLTFRAGAHAASCGAITLLRMRESVLPDVVVLEHLDSARYLSKPADVTRYRHILDRLAVRAAPPKSTATLLRQILDDL